MYIDIHRHSSNPGKADIMLRNLYPEEIGEIQQDKFYSVGLHPWHIASSDYNSELDAVSKASKINEVLAIGETGLDKGIDTDIQIQTDIFHEHIEIAKTANKPIIIHCIKAYNDLVKTRKESKHSQPWIIHWFNASPEMGKDLIRKNCYLSFGISLFKENSKARKTFIEEPLDRIFLETDDASVTIAEVYHKAAELKGISKELLDLQIKKNFNDCFSTSL